MKTIKIGSIITNRGAKYAVTRVVDENNFFAILIGCGVFYDRTTYNGFIKRGDFSCDNVLFKRYGNGFRKVHSINGVSGRITKKGSVNLLKLLDSCNA